MTNEDDSSLQLPYTWTWTTIGEISSLIKGKKPKILGDRNETNNIPYVNIMAFEKKIITKYTDGANCPLCKETDILVVWDGARCGLVGSGSEGAIGSTLGKLVFGEIDGKYLFHFLKSKFEYINKKPRGVGIPHVDPNLFWAIQFPLAPLQEQKRISLKLEALFSFLDAGITSLRKVQAQLKRYRQAVLKNAFEGKLTENWRSAHKSSTDSSKTFLEGLEPVEFSALPILPNGWKWLRIQNVGKITGGLAKNSHRGKCCHNLPYLRVANVYAGHLSLNEIKYIGVNEEEIDKLLLKKGDLLIVEGNGSIDQIGRVAAWDGQISPCIHQNHIIKIRFSDVEDSTYVLYWLLSPNGREHIRKVASSTSGLHTLNLSKVSGLPIPFPPEIERYIIVQEIEQRLSVLEHIEKNLPNLFSLTTKLQQSILNQAFEGRLVSQNPIDEPAEKLLERIKVEIMKQTKGLENAKCVSSNQAELSHYVK